MARVKPTPKNEESPFDLEELFFSSTDQRGVIESGNSVFARVSHYPLEEMIGRPHNIIRHPDMPKSVFQYFWEVLKQDEPIVAYVKNLASDGRYYWVLACAFPFGEGFISLRMKPTTKWFATIQELYKDLSAIEQSGSVSASYAKLHSTVSSLGFSSYRELMRKALSDELTARDHHLRANPKKHVDPDWLLRDNLGLRDLLKTTISSCARAERNYDRVFLCLDEVAKIRASMLEKSRAIERSYQTSQYLSINMSVAAEHAGTAGDTLTVVSQTFGDWSEQADAALKKFIEAMESASQKLEAAAFNTTASRLQIAMITFYSHEIIELETANDARTQTCTNLVPFYGMVETLFTSTEAGVRTVVSELQVLKSHIAKVKESLSALYIVYQSGKVEVARLGDLGTSFDQHLKDMSTFIENVVAQVVQLEEEARTVHTLVTEVEGTLQNFAGILSELTQRGSDLKNKLNSNPSESADSSAA